MEIRPWRKSPLDSIGLSFQSSAPTATPSKLSSDNLGPMMGSAAPSARASSRTGSVMKPHTETSELERQDARRDKPSVEFLRTGGVAYRPRDRSGVGWKYVSAIHCNSKSPTSLSNDPPRPA